MIILFFTASNTSLGIKVVCLSLNEKCLTLRSSEKYDYYFSLLKNFEDFIRQFFKTADNLVL